MDTFVIQGGKKLQGKIVVGGAKNAATPIIAATILVQGTTTLHNVPRISDVEAMLSLLQKMGATVKWDAEHSVSINCDSLDPKKLDPQLIKKMRSSILLLGSLASRFGSVEMPIPGGCQIGTRPVDAHFDVLQQLGFRCESNDDDLKVRKSGAQSDEIIMGEFSVTATENAILASVIGSAECILECVVSDYNVQDLCWFLEACGAHIEGIGSSRLRIKQATKLHGCEYTIMPDAIEAGTFIVLAAATRSDISIESVALDFLTFPLRKFRDAGIHFTVTDERPGPGNKYQMATLHPETKTKLHAVKKLEDMPHPGFPADLMQPFALLMTQAQGNSLIHDWMYDGRLRYAAELQKMGANITVMDPHRIMIIGPTPLYGKEITSYDLRAGATLILAGLIAEGETVIYNISQVDRGYEHLDERLRAIGAHIERK